jgi:putative ABC transport system permease protein
MWRYLRALLLRGQHRVDSREEMGFHVEMYVAERMRAGLSEAEARRRARIDLGDVDAEAESLQDQRPGASLETAWLDLRHAVRGLGRSPAFSLMCVLLIALGVFASTALFSVVERILLRPLSYSESERLVRVFETSPRRGISRIGVARGNLAFWRREATLFEGMAVGYSMGRTLSEGGHADVALMAQVSCDFFPLLGVQALHGRLFDEDECRRARYSGALAPVGPDPVVVLGNGFWKRRFGGDAGVVGRTVTIERRPFRVVGVLPAELDLPDRGVQAFLAWELEAELPHDQRYTTAVARLARGASHAAAEAELAGLAARLAREYPQTNEDWTVGIVPLHVDATAGARSVLLVLLAGSVLVLLIASGNVALLFLARSSARSPEVALRLCLGAGRGRILRQGLMEAGAIAALGGALGYGLAAWSVAVLPLLWPDLPRVHELRVDGFALAFALLATFTAALLAGGVPALRMAGMDPTMALERGERTTSARRTQRTRDALVVAEVATTIVLLSGAGLVARSVFLMRAADPGFDPEGVLVAPVFLDTQEYGSGDKSRAYYARLFERLRALPGVVAAGGATTVPTSPLGPDFARPVWPLGREGDSGSVQQAWIRMITPGYLEALHIPVVAGRPFSAADDAGAKRVVAVSQSLARILWARESPVGKSLVVDYSTAGTYPYEIVGVFGDVQFRGPRSEPVPEVYFPHAQRPYLILNVAVRSTTSHPLSAAELRRIFADIDPQKPPQGVHRLSDLLGATFLFERRAMQLLSAFAAVACLLSGLGIYGMLAYRVRLRAQEIGVRVALGASRARVIRFVTWEGGRLLVLGVLAGFLGALASGRVIAGLLYGVSPNDLLTAVTVLAIIAVVGALAIWLPALRATRLDPAQVLRKA